MAPDEPDLLDTRPSAPPRARRRTTLTSAGVISAVALVGGGAWAASWYLGSGPSATDMLPSTTRAYVAVDLDPSGSQKIDALRTLRRFPALAHVGLGSTDDLRRKAWDSTGGSSTCRRIDYDRDIKPWLGDRMAVADVPDRAGQDAPVVVAEVTDQAAAQTGIRRILTCSGGSARTMGVAFSDGWAVIAGSTAEAKRVVEETGRAPLSSDAGYQRLMARAGSAGVLSAYVAPGSERSLARLLDGGTPATSTSADSADHTSLALQVRFSGHGLEAEYAGSGVSDTISRPDSEAVTGLPADTGAAVGGGLAAGWADHALDALATAWHSDRAQLVREAHRYTGLTVPADLETLLGHSFALGVSTDLGRASTGSVPVGLRVVGDPTGIDAVLARLRGTGLPSSYLRSSSDGDRVGIGPDAAWDAALARTGTLGDSATFRAVVPDADHATSILYLDAARDDWLVRALTAAGVSGEVTDNLKPVAALGASSTQSGSTVHGLLRLTTR